MLQEIPKEQVAFFIVSYADPKTKVTYVLAVPSLGRQIRRVVSTTRQVRESHANCRQGHVETISHENCAVGYCNQNNGNNRDLTLPEHTAKKI